MTVQLDHTQDPRSGNKSVVDLDEAKQRLLPYAVKVVVVVVIV